jgi:hypothetical protein
MGRHKKDRTIQTDEVDETEKTVRVLSLRPGTIYLTDGRALTHNSVMDVTEEMADWLLASFAGLVRKV